MHTETAMVEAVSAISAESFFSTYHQQNRPVLLVGFVRVWPAFERWSMQHFARRYGQVEVDVMTGLSADPHYERSAGLQSRRMSMQDFVDAIEDGPNDGDIYLVAQNHALKRPGLAPLGKDLILDSGFFDPHDALSKISLWMGPGNTVTPLHYDLQNLILAQIYGSKRFYLISPGDTPWVYNRNGGYSEVNPEHPDFAAFPLFVNARVFTADLNAGDALFIPDRWWHHVRALSPSISLSLSNLAR